jgi:flavin-binding protein dodecin
VAAPFERRPAATGLGRLVGSRRACIREIEDVLAQAPGVRDVTPEQVAGIAARHGLDLRTQLATSRRELYRRLLEHDLNDQVLSEEESADVEHLRRLLELTDTDAAQVHDHVARGVYGQAIDQVLADHRIDPEERDFLRRLGGTLTLSEETRERLHGEAARRARQRFLERTLVHDSVFVASRDRVLELTGSSTRSLEDAIQSALVEAARAVPDLRHFEVTQIRGAVESGSVARWEIALRASFTPLE